MGSSTTSTTVAARSSVNSRNRSAAISLIMSAEGIITGGGVTVVSSTTVRELVGEEICALRASSARRALWYAPRSPTLVTIRTRFTSFLTQPTTLHVPYPHRSEEHTSE